MRLGERIKMVRQKAFLTQEEFADQLNVTISTVNRWEHNKVRPNLKAMRAIKEFCDDKGIPYSDIEYEWLRCGSDDYE